MLVCVRRTIHSVCRQHWVPRGFQMPLVRGPVVGNHWPRSSRSPLALGAFVSNMGCEGVQLARGLQQRSGGGS